MMRVLNKYLLIYLGIASAGLGYGAGLGAANFGGYAGAGFGAAGLDYAGAGKTIKNLLKLKT